MTRNSGVRISPKKILEIVDPLSFDNLEVGGCQQA